MAGKTQIAHPSVEERRAHGQQARSRAALSSHTGWVPAPTRPDPVGLLEEQNHTREPDLVPVRHGRMLVSPFTFYRGGAKLMAADLKATPTAGLQVQLCGDAHLSNFGVFASPERRLLFDLNDFDETLPGPFEYDVKRMAASFTIAARNNGPGGPLANSRYRQHGERVMAGQRMLQAASDIFLGWTNTGHEGLSRGRDDGPVGLDFYAGICGWTLARAHARSGDPIAIAEYLGASDRFDRSIADFSQRYADQNELDYEAFVKAIRSGRLEAHEGV
jgi:hypothetical protein